MQRLRPCAVLLSMLLSTPALRLSAQASPFPQMSFVPWKVLNAGDRPPAADLILYWLPASREELRRSPLLTSRPLSTYSALCVAMQVVRPDDFERLSNLQGTSLLPAVVLVDSSGTVLARVDSTSGPFSSAEAETLVRGAIATRDVETDRLLDLAARQAAAGQKEAAAESYRRVSALRCSFPRKARAAERALRKLGAGNGPPR